MAGTGLQGFSVMHQGFDGVSSFCTCKFFFVCLSSFDNRDCQYLLAEICIQIQHLDGSLFCFLSRCMCGMSFLPQEFSGTQERTGCLLPAHNGTPLVIYFRQISVGLDLFCIEITEQGLGSRTDAQTLLQRFESAVCYPCNFRCKSFYVVFFFLQKAFRNQHWHIHIFYACFFESSVKFMLDIFPDRITRRFDRHTSFYTGVINQICFFYYIGIPLCEILFHGSDRFYHFFVFCHLYFLHFCSHVLSESFCA